MITIKVTIRTIYSFVLGNDDGYTDTKIRPVSIIDINTAVMTDNQYLPIFYGFRYSFDTFWEKLHPHS